MLKGKRARIILACGAIGLGLLSTILGAATFTSSRPTLAMGVNGAFVIPRLSDHRNHFGGGLSLFLALSKNFALELTGQFSRGSTLGNMDDPENSLSKGALQQIPVQLMLQVRLPIGRFPIVPYVTGGGGFSFNSFTLDADTAAAYKGLGFDIAESIDPAPVLCAGGGLDIIPTRSLIISLQCLYRFSQADGAWSISDEISGAEVHGSLEGLKLDSLVLGLGLKFVF